MTIFSVTEQQQLVHRLQSIASDPVSRNYTKITTAYERIGHHNRHTCPYPMRGPITATAAPSLPPAPLSLRLFHHCCRRCYLSTLSSSSPSSISLSPLIFSSFICIPLCSSIPFFLYPLLRCPSQCSSSVPMSFALSPSLYRSPKLCRTYLLRTFEGPHSPSPP